MSRLWAWLNKHSGKLLTVLIVWASLATIAPRWFQLEHIASGWGKTVVLLLLNPGTALILTQVSILVAAMGSMFHSSAILTMNGTISTINSAISDLADSISTINRTISGLADSVIEISGGLSTTFSNTTMTLSDATKTLHEQMRENQAQIAELQGKVRKLQGEAS